MQVDGAEPDAVDSNNRQEYRGVCVWCGAGGVGEGGSE